MNLYEIVRPLLFSLPPEQAHLLTLRALDLFSALRLTSLFSRIPSLPRHVMGLDFPNPLGLAAGLDKNAEHLNGLSSLGFGFLEVGTVTPKPQLGNPRPRLFRLPDDEAIINRMGFNNVGVETFVNNLERSAFRGILGVNIGKNSATPAEEAVQDYLHCFRATYRYASYLVVNVSSPNTVGLRALQAAEWLTPLLSALKQEQETQRALTNRYVPLAVKVAPDLDEGGIDEVCAVLQAQSIDAVIATNTTIRREGVEHREVAKEAGGLSGKPLSVRSRQVVKAFADRLGSNIPIIGSGGVMSGDDALALFDSGASLVQIYTGLIYHGPKLISDILSAERAAKL